MTIYCWYKPTFGIINHFLSNCFGFLIEKNSAVNLEPPEVLTTVYLRKKLQSKLRAVGKLSVHLKRIQFFCSDFSRIFTKVISKDI